MGVTTLLLGKQSTLKEAQKVLEQLREHHNGLVQHAQTIDIRKKNSEYALALLQIRTRETSKEMALLFTKMLQISLAYNNFRKNSLACKGRHKIYELGKHPFTRSTHEQYAKQLEDLKTVLDYLHLVLEQQ